MRREEAEQLLGGYATGTLTEAERRLLCEAALARQDLFDALADEEALRELLADPMARDQLLAALAPRVVPLWRRPGVLGVAAGLLVAGLAGLAVLHGPGGMAVPRAAAPLPVPRADVATPAVKAPEPAVPKPPAPPARKVAPAPPEPLPAPAPRQLPTSNRVFEAPAALAPAGAVASEQAARTRMQAQMKAESRSKAGAQATQAGGVRVEAMDASPSVAPESAQAKAARALATPVEVGAPEPAWGVATRADGSLRVTVLALPGRPVLLLRRGPAGVVVVWPVEEGREGPQIRWRIDLRPAPGEALDLYILNTAVADPAGLPAEGPVNGFRTRIPVPEKKSPVP